MENTPMETTEAPPENSQRGVKRKESPPVTSESQKSRPPTSTQIVSIRDQERTSAFRRKVGAIAHTDATQFRDGRQVKKGLLSKVSDQVGTLSSHRQKLQKIRDLISIENPDLRVHTEAPSVGYELENIHGDLNADGQELHQLFTTGTSTAIDLCDNDFGVCENGYQISLGPLRCTADQAAELVAYIDIVLKTLFDTENTAIAGELPPDAIWSGEYVQFVHLAFKEPVHAATILAAPDLLQRVPCIPRGRDSFRAGTETVPRVRHAPAEPEIRAPVEGRKVAVQCPGFTGMALGELKEALVKFEESIGETAIESVCKGAMAGTGEAADCDVIQLLMTTAKLAVMLANNTIKFYLDGEQATCELVASTRVLREAQETEIVFYDNAGLFRVGYDEACIQEGVDKAVMHATQQKTTQLLPLPTTRTQLGSDVSRQGSFVRHRPMRSGNMWLLRASSTVYEFSARQEKQQQTIDLYHVEAGEIQVILTLGKFSRKGEKGTGAAPSQQQTDSIAALNSVWEQRLSEVRAQAAPQPSELADHKELIDLTKTIKSGIENLQTGVGDIKHATAETATGLESLIGLHGTTNTTLSTLSTQADNHKQSIENLQQVCNTGFVAVTAECQNTTTAVNAMVEAQRNHETRMLPLYHSMIDKLVSIEANTREARVEEEARKRAKARPSSRQGDRPTHTEEYLQAQLTLLASQQQEQAAKLAQQPQLIQQPVTSAPLQNLQNIQNVHTLASLQGMGLQLPRG
ncbi:hypothetical protein CYMTET_18498 [Cymbomonas tetramitiformis]|uniref:Uncharacterized protein n=1 Tax=Cymbomonas tetramitiformis TaxID=36881 RepID=A0AAE0G8A0_9CHLO|nr:hypothetical protein CYMTET_18498 [Cymbomonas tetramitiformis]|eukprot:gene7449-8871_t